MIILSTVLLLGKKVRPGSGSANARGDFPIICLRRWIVCPADLPPAWFGSRLGPGEAPRYGSLEVTLPDGRAVKLGNNGTRPGRSHESL